MIVNLGCIVEGDGDVPAVRILLRRIQQELAPSLDLRLLRPWRTGRSKLVTPGELEGTIEKIARKLATPRAVLILIDADVDCPKWLGPQLLTRAATARPDISVGVVLAKHEFEAWFLASPASIAGKRGLHENLPAVPDPEAIRGAKEWLSRHMTAERTYAETVDQPALAAIFDMQAARDKSPSFDKCWREVERLLAEAR